MIDPELKAAIRARYRDRPDRLSEVLRNAETWERLKAVALIGVPE